MAKSFEPMASATYDPKKPIKFPVMGSPKIDGFRIVMVEGVPMTRQLKRPVPNLSIQRQLSRVKAWFDGELVVGNPYGGNVLRRTQAGVTAEEGTPDWTYMVFDICDPMEKHLPFKERYRRAQERVAKWRFDLDEPHRLVMVPHVDFGDEVGLWEYEDAMVKYGYEGIMIRDPFGTYKWGRSTLPEGGLIKIKRWEDAEAVILGTYEEEENTNEATTTPLGRSQRSSSKAGKVGKGTLGGFHCMTYTGKKKGRWDLANTAGEKVYFDLGAAANTTREERDRLWGIRDLLPGKIVTFKYQVRVGAEKPQHPTFKDFYVS